MKASEIVVTKTEVHDGVAVEYFDNNIDGKIVPCARVRLGDGGIYWAVVEGVSIDYHVQSVKARVHADSRKARLNEST